MSGFSAKLLQGKVGIVTGAGSPYGIGRSLVLSLAAAGARAVYATDLTTKHIASLRDEVKKSGSSCEVREHVLDVTDEAQTIEVLKKIIADFGRLDFYFANAGVGLYKCAASQHPYATGTTTNTRNLGLCPRLIPAIMIR